MTARILLVTANADARQALEDTLISAWDQAEDGGSLETPLFDYAPTVSDCHRRLEADGDKYQLVVTTLQVPKDRRSTRDDMEERSFEVARACAGHDEVDADILITTAYGSSESTLGELQVKASEFQRCRLMPSDPGPAEAFLANIIRARKSKKRDDETEESAEPETPQVTVDIDLHGDEATYTLSSGFGRPDSGLLEISEYTLGQLRNLSELVPDIGFPGWIRQMRVIGEIMFEQLETGNTAFWRALSERAKGHPERARYRFTLRRDDYPIMVEAMVPKAEGAEPDVRDFWMLKTPVLRRLTPPQFGGAQADQNVPRIIAPRAAEQPLNCLIIEADAHTGTPFTVGTRTIRRLQHLDNVVQECDWLESYLTETLKDETGAGGQPLIGHVERINREMVTQRQGVQAEFKKVLSGILSEERWHLVHFAGHSYYDQNFKDEANDRKGRGWLFLPGPDGEIEQFSAERFAAFGQQRPELVYLSSCHGSREDVAFELGRSLVPAIVGFRWDIPDSEAVLHAKCFYEALFAPDGGLETAFLRTRQKMFERNREHKTWAASMLVLEA